MVREACNLFFSLQFFQEARNYILYHVAGERLPIELALLSSFQSFYGFIFMFVFLCSFACSLFFVSLFPHPYFHYSYLSSASFFRPFLQSILSYFSYFISVPLLSIFSFYPSFLDHDFVRPFSFSFLSFRFFLLPFSSFFFLSFFRSILVFLPSIFPFPLISFILF